MPQVSVTIDGKSYRIACGEGEEGHLAGLAADLDARVVALRRSFGEIGDMRLQVMAALTLVDELGEARTRAADADAQARASREDEARRTAVRAHEEARTVEGITRAADRIERMARILGGAVPARKPGA